MTAYTIQLPAEVDIEEERAELFAALQSIEDLRHQHPYDATGPALRAGHAPIPAPTGDARSVNTKTNPNTNLAPETPRIPAPAPEMAL